MAHSTIFMLPNQAANLTCRAHIIGAELAADQIPLAPALSPFILAVAELAGLVVDPTTGCILGLADAPLAILLPQ